MRINLEDNRDGLQAPLLKVEVGDLLRLAVLVLAVVVFLEEGQLLHGFAEDVGEHSFDHLINLNLMKKTKQTRKHSFSNYLSAAQRLTAFTRPTVVDDSPKKKEAEIANISLHESSFESVDLSEESRRKIET